MFLPLANRLLQPNYFQAMFNLLRRDQFSFSRSGTRVTGSFPCLRRLDVTFPEWPRPALPWTHRVDGAACRFVVENAISVGLLAEAAVGGADMQGEHLLDRLATMFGDGGDLGFIDPDEARLAGAAMAAAGAAETQAVLIPGFGHDCVEPRPRGSQPVSVSVIIPTLNEESCLAETLRRLRQERPHEIIVVDGGSSDATCQLAHSGADILLHSPPGRAAQMNFGSTHATGDVLVFLHADCWLEPGALQDAERCLCGPGVIAGCFQMKVQANALVYRVIDAAATARVRLIGVAYGDQGLFLRKDTFDRLGGFPRLRFMEDLLFSKELRKHGRIAVARKHIFVSPRRWQRTGIVKQTLRNWILTALAAAGVPADRLARCYPMVR